LCTASHALSVLWHGVLGCEFGVHVGEELRWGSIAANRWHLIRSCGCRVGHVRVQWLLDLVFTVGFGRIVRALVESIELVAAGSGEAERAVTGAREGEHSPRRACYYARGCHGGICDCRVLCDEQLVMRYEVKFAMPREIQHVIAFGLVIAIVTLVDLSDLLLLHS
jgi:hypothetical protein